MGLSFFKKQSFEEDGARLGETIREETTPLGGKN